MPSHKKPQPAAPAPVAAPRKSAAKRAPPKTKTASAAPAAAAEPVGDLLSARQEQFALGVALGLSQSEAYRKAYPASTQWKPETVHSRASELAANGKVSGRISELLAKAAAANEVTVADVLRAYLNVATADPREIVGYLRRSCRFCYGVGHKRQRTPDEMQRDRLAHAKERRKNPDLGEFDEEGGIGYDPRREPADDCPECFGEGEGRVVICDTRGFNTRALALYAGVKEGKDGTEVKLHDQMAAWAQIARHVGFFEKDNEQVTGVFANKAELDAIYDRKLAAGLARSKAAKGRLARLGIKDSEPGSEPG